MGRFLMASGVAGYRTAVICPGHGGEHDHMRDRVADQRPDLLALAARLCGDDPFARIADGTAYVQPAVYCASLAGWETVRQELEPTAVAGHSLGELAAAAIGGAISDEDGLRLAVLRGRACQAAAGDSSGGMLVLKANRARASTLAAEYGLQVVNENAPEQTVVAGAEEGLGELQGAARRLGVSATRLRVGIPFHTEAMQSAAEALGEMLASVDVGVPRCTIVSAATARPFTDLRTELAQALVRPVRWHAVALALAERGATHFVETGPGRTLARLVSQSLDGFTVDALEDALG